MEVTEVFEKLLGLGEKPENLTMLHVAMRSLVIFIVAIILVRLGAKRFFARKTAFDLILAFILGSMLSRAINGSAPFVPTLVGGVALVLIHRLFAALAFHSAAFGSLIKGNDEIVIEDGKILEAALRKNYLS